MLICLKHWFCSVRIIQYKCISYLNRICSIEQILLLMAHGQNTGYMDVSCILLMGDKYIMHGQCLFSCGSNFVSCKRLQSMYGRKQNPMNIFQVVNSIVTDVHFGLLQVL